MKILSKIIVALAFLAINPVASASPLYLGNVDLSAQLEREVLKLPPCSASWNRPVTEVKLEVRRNAADIEFVRVKFQNGDTYRLNVREFFQVNSSSRWIDLQGYARCIREIRIVGDAVTFGHTPRKKSRIFLLGR